jgi:Flp pilus assembly secretin CpaC
MSRLSNFSALLSASTTALGSILVLTTVSLTVAGPANAGDLIARYDQSQLLRLPRPVSEIIIGNPSIADVTIQGGNLLVVTGKTFGITNIIALDADRNIIQDQRVVVERDPNLVNVHRGVQRQTYSCTPNCEPNLTIGDDQEFFNKVNTQNGSKIRASETGTASEGGGQ